MDAQVRATPRSWNLVPSAPAAAAAVAPSACPPSCPRLPSARPSPVRRMDAVYEGAVDAVGGIDAAKPRAVFDAMAAAAGVAPDDAAATAFAGTELAGLTVQAVKWKLLAHR